MKRRLFNLLAAVSLVMCLATGVLWVRSYWVADVVTLRTRNGYERAIWNADSTRGTCGLGRNLYVLSLRSRPSREWQWERIPPEDVGDTWHGFRIKRMEDRGIFSWRMTSVWVPHWLPVLILAICPTWWLVRERKRRALRAVGCCKTCGYDLRATPERCPECGTVPAAESEVAKA